MTGFVQRCKTEIRSTACQRALLQSVTIGRFLSLKRSFLACHETQSRNLPIVHARPAPFGRQVPARYRLIAAGHDGQLTGGPIHCHSEAVRGELQPAHC